MSSGSIAYPQEYSQEYSIKKPYVAFWGDTYYPLGGFFDKHEFFKNENDAISFAKLLKGNYQWTHVYDVYQKEIIYDSDEENK